MSQQQQQHKSFGRDEMAALLGGADQILYQPTTSFSAKALNKEKDMTDLSHLSATEAAALLKQEKSHQQQQQKRHRTTRVMKHHEALEELERLQATKTRNHDYSESSSSESEDDAFAQTVRKRTTPQIVLVRDAKEDERQLQRRRQRRRYDSTSSSSEEDSQPSDGSSDDDDSMDDRRQRLLAKKRAKEKEEAPEKIPGWKEPPIKMETTTSAKEASHAIHRDKSDDESEKETSSSSDDESVSSTSDDDHDDHNLPPPIMAKPLFVPKHKRQTIVSVEEQEQKELLQKQLLQKQEEQRKLESRKLVAAIVADSSLTIQQELEEDEAGGASNAMPDDEDVGDEQERDAWEVRELQRLLEEEDMTLLLKQEREEYERRKQLTDEERLEEDIATGRYRQPGQEKEQGVYMQRFYHRGAFYMDKDQWDEDDVRHKAKEYARAATGEDKIDKRNLPEVMQVKKFGFARQNHKYKGLAKEDTTDKQMEMLPIVKNQNKGNQEMW